MPQPAAGFVEGFAQGHGNQFQVRRQAVVPEVREELLHLAGQTVDVPPLRHARIVAMASRRAAAGAGVGFLAYLWVAAVRAAPGIRARKAARRALRRTG